MLQMVVFGVVSIYFTNFFCFSVVWSVYTITEKVALGVVFTVTKFRIYVLNQEIAIQTDYQVITFIKQCKLSHGRLTRWTLAFQEYNIRREYIQGKKNIVADVLSRVKEKENSIGKHTYKTLGTFRNKLELERVLQDLPQQQCSDQKLH